MTRTKVNMDQERNIITNLIVSKEFAQQILPLLQPKYFKTKYAKTVSAWVKDYWDEYEDVPGKNIQSIFESHRGSFFDEEEAESVSDFLVSLADSYNEVSIIHNPTFAKDNAEKYLKLRSLEIFEEQLKLSIMEGDAQKGEALVANFKRVGRPQGESADILNDPEKVAQAFFEENEYLFSFPGALQKVIGDPQRGDLMAFLGKQKGKKSYAMLYTAECAMSYGCQVAYISLEMRESQIIRRAWQSLTGSPRNSGYFDMPYFAPQFDDAEIPDAQKRWKVERKNEYRDAVNLKSIRQYQDALKMQFNGGRCKFETFPSNTATVEDIVNYLDNQYYYENFVPDVLVVDYADILRPSKGSGMEKRHQIGDIWLKLRSIAQSRNILVVTASQSNRAGLTGDLELDNLAEDITKAAHVSLLVALNQTKPEREMGIMRLDAIAQRDDGGAFDQAVITQCLDVGRFCMDSRLSKSVEKVE